MIKLIETLNISSSPYVNALLAIVVFVIIAKIADLLIDKVIRRFSRFTRTDIDDRIIDVVHKPIFFTIIIMGIIHAVRSFEPSERTLFYSEANLHSLLVIIWCVAAIRISNSLIEHVVRRMSDVTGMSRDIIPLVENVSRIVVILGGVMAVLSIWHINITPVIASAGIAGAAVAFAAKDTIANFFGGISVFADKPFKIGDFIVLDSGDRGEVVAIGVRSTRLQTQDGVQITVPNSIIASTKIINESAPLTSCRLRVPVSAAYGSDIDLVQGMLLEVARNNENVLGDPLPLVLFTNFGDSSINFELLCWIREPSRKGLTLHELNCAIYKAFGRAGIVVPFPQRDVHIHQKQ